MGFDLQGEMSHPDDRIPSRYNDCSGKIYHIIQRERRNTANHLRQVKTSNDVFVFAMSLLKKNDTGERLETTNGRKALFG